MKIKFKKYAEKKKIGKKIVDIFSAGHFIKGFISFLVLYVLLSRLNLNTADNYYCSLLGVIFLSLGWEILENYVWRMIKPNGIDSLKNSLSDIIFDLAGGINAWILILIINTFVI